MLLLTILRLNCNCFNKIAFMSKCSQAGWRALTANRLSRGWWCVLYPITGHAHGTLLTIEPLRIWRKYMRYEVLPSSTGNVHKLLCQSCTHRFLKSYAGRSWTVIFSLVVQITFVSALSYCDKLLNCMAKSLLQIFFREFSVKPWNH